MIGIENSLPQTHPNPDTNNARYRVWFFFSVQKAKKNQRALFHITNFSKSKSLYREGMSPLVRSSSRPTWQRVPEKNVFYYKKQLSKKSYVLSWLFEFDRPDETFYFAYCFPYTYTRLQKYLCAIERRSLPFFKRELLCRTIQHRRLDLLTITSGAAGPASAHEGKKVVIITARVHPGETPASYILEGIVDFLTADTPEARTLRAALMFKIVPMLNPDGVFLGNYRCSYLGYDLNRFWAKPDSWGMPELRAARRLALRYASAAAAAAAASGGGGGPGGGGADPLEQSLDIDRDGSGCELDVFIDIHAHSTASNSFMYCNGVDDDESIEKESIFPRLLDANSRDFSFSQTRFDADPSKEGTGRRALGELLAPSGVHCYTLEVSFFAAKNEEQDESVPFTPESYKELGRGVAVTFLDFYNLRRERPSRRGSGSIQSQRLRNRGTSAHERQNDPTANR